MSEKKVAKNTIVKDALILCVITLISGFLLGFVYDLTADRRAKAEQDAKNEAYKLIYPAADAFNQDEKNAKKVEDSKDFFDGKSYSADNVEYDFAGIEVNELIKAQKGEEMLGYIVSVTTPNGYGGDIQVAIGIDKDGKIAGTQILAIDETPGLGMNAKGEFIEQFTGKKVDGFVHTKNGASKENEIDAITSATITTEAVTGAINAGLTFVNEQILEGTENSESAEDVENADDEQNAENNEDTGNMDIPEIIEGIDDAGNPEGIEGVENMDTPENIEGIEGAESSESLENNENVE